MLNSEKVFAAKNPANARRELEMTAKLVLLAELRVMDQVWRRYDMRGLSAHFQRNGWVVLRDCIPALVRADMAKYASDILGDGAAMLDKSLHRTEKSRVMVGSDRASRMCARLLTHGIREIVQHSLIPSHFTLLFEYRYDHGILLPHIDGNPITMSICLDANGSWPLKAGTFAL